MLAHLLNTHDFQGFPFQGKNQPVEARQVDCPLTKAVPLEGVTTEDGKSFQFIYVLGLLDGIDT